MVVHRDPKLLNPPAPPEQITVRKNLWWWMLHLDQQYSVALGRPLGISSMGDCPPPEPLVADPIVQSLSNYINQYTLLARQILSAGYLNNEQIDLFTDQLIGLKRSLPEPVSFDQSWLNHDKPLPPWPLDVQAAAFHGKTHNMILLLNRQRIENTLNTNAPAPFMKRDPDEGHIAARGRERVLQSSRALLHAFEFFHSRVRAALICWTIGQQAFNAAMILVLSMFETKDPQDLHIVQLAMSTFHEMSRLGVHKLAGPALEKLTTLMREFQAGEAAKEKVMGNNGMFLLEDPGLQGFKEEFSPLHFEMAGGPIPQDRPTKRRSAGTDLVDFGSSSKHASGQQRRGKTPTKPAQNRGIRPKAPTTKSLSRTQKPPALRRLSQISPKIPSEPVRTAHSAGDIPLMMPEPGALGYLGSQAESAPQTAFPAEEHPFSPFSTSDFNSNAQMQNVDFHAAMARSATYPQNRSFFPQPQGGIPGSLTEDGRFMPTSAAEEYQQAGQHPTSRLRLTRARYTNSTSLRLRLTYLLRIRCRTRRLRFPPNTDCQRSPFVQPHSLYSIRRVFPSASFPITAKA